jgi:outer membrane lipoprotein-sorting protein
MNRRTLFALPLLLVPGLTRAAPAVVPLVLTPQDRTDLGRIEQYLNGLRTLKGRFLQIAPDGGTSEGTVWLQRPGRMRFEYDPPAPFLLVAGFGILTFQDRKLDQVSNIPLGQTPLGILLADQVKLSGDVTVTELHREPGLIAVTTQRAGSPGDGSLTLYFDDKPLALRQWAVVDAQRRETRVSLYNVELGQSFDQALFNAATIQKQPVR